MINDITFRIAMVLMVHYGYEAKIFDVETVFLHGDLEERIYMDCPDGMEAEDDECLILEKSSYGLRQVSIQYAKKYCEVLESMGFKSCPSDPCLFMRGTDNERLFILTYVDDNLCIGKKEAIESFLTEFKSNEFTFTVEDTLEDYLSCEQYCRRMEWAGLDSRT